MFLCSSPLFPSFLFSYISSYSILSPHFSTSIFLDLFTPHLLFSMSLTFHSHQYHHSRSLLSLISSLSKSPLIPLYLTQSNTYPFLLSIGLHFCVLCKSTYSAFNITYVSITPAFVYSLHSVFHHFFKHIIFLLYSALLTYCIEHI